MLFIERPERALIRAINRLNNLDPALLETDVEWGTPENWIQGTTNTRVRMSMVNTQNYTGSIEFYYNRIRVYDYFNGWTVPGKASDYSTTREAIEAMYTKYSLPLDPDDIVSRTVNPVDTGLIVQGRNTSLMFVPSQTVSLPFEEN